jgi:hypothetical protein
VLFHLTTPVKESVDTGPLSESTGHVLGALVLYGCETWCLTLREESKLRMFEDGVLRRIFGLKRK